MYKTTLHLWQAIYWKKKCYNVTVPVATFKHLPAFNVGKTEDLDRLCLENYLKYSRANFGRLFVCWL